MKLILQKILAVLARATIRKYNPVVIGITGSVGKTSTRQAIFTVLKKKFSVRTAEKNYNNEIGFPLTILGMPHCGRNILKWFWEFIFVILRLMNLIRKEYPKILVLEYGIDRPGDMDYLLSIAKPRIGVLTAIGEIPVHVEFFKNPEDLRKEKYKLIEALPKDGWAILNHDDPSVYDAKKSSKAQVITFGTEKHADVRIVNFKLSSSKDEKLGDIPSGIVFKIEHEGDVVPFRLHNTFGFPQAYAAAAAAAVGVALNKILTEAGEVLRGINLVEISEALHTLVPPVGRLRLLKGIKNSWILDDTYNAAPESMRAALATLKELPGRRKIAVLGDMLEIGEYSEQAHRAVGDRAAEFVDMLFTVGPRAKFIADEALTRGIEKNARRLLPEQVFKFDDSVSAGKALDPLIQEGDLILVKGSQAMRMEKVVFEIMAEPQRAAELLVRQDNYWKSK